MSRSWEILGRPFATPDPDDLEKLARLHRAVCVNVADARDRLDAIGSQLSTAVWSGQAAHAFAESYGALPGQFDKAWTSYNTVASALSAYAGEVRDIAGTLTTIDAAAQDAQAHLGMLRATQADAVRIQEAEAELGDLSKRLASALADLGACAENCVRQIQLASSQGIQNQPLGFFGFIVEELLDPVLNDVFGVGVFVTTELYNIFLQPFIALPGDIVELAEHPSFHTLGIALGDAGSVVGTLALVVAAATPGVDALGAPALAARLSVLSKGIAATSLGIDGGALASDTVAVTTHEHGARWSEVGKEALAVGGKGGERLFQSQAFKSFFNGKVNALKVTTKSALRQIEVDL